MIKRKYMELFMTVVMLLVIAVFSFGANGMGTGVKYNKKAEKDKKEEYIGTVVLDAGHGGNDPGKVGVNKCIESDINLSIVLKLKDYLEKNNVQVVLTRKDKNGLYDENDTNKKVTDMKNRCKIINEADCDLMVSIHQNSYSSSGVKGAQVFYFKNSNDGEKIAKIIQARLIDEVDKDNGRQSKDNDSYYILKNVECPAVIVECGFLSNYEEAELLCDEKYQEKLAIAIGNGIIEYLSK